MTPKIVVARALCGKPARHGAPCGLDKNHVRRGERHSNGAFTWALRGKESTVVKKTDDDDERMDGTDCGVRAAKGQGRACTLKQGHEGNHRSKLGGSWPNKPPKVCGDTRGGADSCTKPKKHGGMHYSEQTKTGWSDGWRDDPKPPRAPAKPSKPAAPKGAVTAPLDRDQLLGHRRHAACALWPLVEGEPFDELVASIKERGLEDDIVTVKVDGETFILDGWNRLRACLAAGVRPRFTKYIGKADLVSLREYVDARNAHRRHITKGQLAMISAAGDRLCVGKPSAKDKGKSAGERAKAKGLSRRLQMQADRVHDNATKKVKAAAASGKMSVEAAESLSRLSAKDQDELADKALAGAGEMKTGKLRAMAKQQQKRATVQKINKEQVRPMPVGPFRVIVVDPPWPYDNGDQHEGSRGHMPYPPMSIAQICQLSSDIDKLVHEDGCILGLYVTNAFIHEVGRVLEAWHFTHRTMRTWFKDKVGLGTWCRGQTEHLVIASRGIPVHTLNEVTTRIEGKIREHSRKPDEPMEAFEKHCPGPYVELFAREPRANWASWGAETNKFTAAKESAA